MVPLTERDAFITEAQKDHELRPILAFIFGERVTDGTLGATTRSKVFDAIRGNESKKFGEVVGDLNARKFSADSDWIGDDCMVFLLLLGVKRFGIGEQFSEKLLNARRKTADPQTQGVNQAFEAIRRGEFAMEGDFAFIKCVYRTLAENWSPSDSDSVKLYKQLKSLPVGELDPFLRLLALRAFDLVMESRSVSLDAGNWAQVVQKLQEEGGKLSFGQLVGLLKHVRIGVLVSIALVFGTVFGAGHVWSWWGTKSAAPKRITPSGKLSVRTEPADSINVWTAPLVKYLDSTSAIPTNLVPVTLIADSDPFKQPTEPFLAKGCFLLASNVNVLCFLMRPASGLTSSIPVEVQTSNNCFSAFIPRAEPGDQIRFFVHSALHKRPSLDSLETALKIVAARQ
jgi:hypothetical protein